MNCKTNKLRDAVVLALVVSAGTTTGTALAQEANSESPTNLDRIEVTGSRIRSVDVENSQPILVMTREDIQKQGVTSVADVLARVSSTGAGVTTTYNNGGDGSATVDLRNLGSARTLVLVNGRRWVSGLTGSVDLNTIPAAVIERIEILKDGASSIYGSDAISGVVNIITRSNFDGAEINGYVGQYGEGDGQRTSFDATVGLSGDRGNLVIGLSHTKEDEVMAGNRAISAVPYFGYGSSTFSSYSAAGKINRSVAQGGNIVLPNNAVGSGLADSPYYALDQYVPYTTAAYGYNYAKDNYLITPQKRDSMYVQGSYDLTESIRFKLDGLYNERRSAQRLAGFPLSTINTGIAMSGDSYYNPYNTAYGNDGRDVSWTHRLTESPRLYEQNVKTSHVYAGLEGEFEFSDRRFNWDAGYSYNKSDQTETQYGDVNLISLGNALGASGVVDGQVRCLDTSGDVIDGCVPFNPLSPAGAIPQDQLDYILFTAHNTYQYRSESATANISGEIVELPAGWLSFAAGYEHRKESGFSSPDALIASGNTSGNAFTPTSGQYTLDDYYLELAVPLLKDMPGAQLLEVSLAGRFSDYDTFGTTTNYKFGLKWKPIEDLLIRGNYATGFRAPSIEDLYLGSADDFATYSDPCSSNDSNYAAVAANCQARGVPADFVAQYNSATGNSGQTIYPFTNTSNPDLKPETATNFTLGFVYSPSYVSGLDISLDWWKIKLEDSISSPSANYILEQCYQNNVSSYCDLVTRDATGLITAMTIQPLNFGKENVEGYDFTVKYKLPETSFGTFSLSSDSTYVAKRETQVDETQPWESNNGIYWQWSPNWRLRSSLGLDWTLGDFSAAWTVRYYSGLKDYEWGQDADGNYNQVPSVTYNDLQLTYNLPWNGTIRLGANNLFDRDPPVIMGAFANSFDPHYPIPGRYTYMQYTQRF
jgi:iron complex outermembrane recepter protein